MESPTPQMALLRRPPPPSSGKLLGWLTQPLLGFPPGFPGTPNRATEVVGWSPASQCPSCGLGERIPLGPGSSSVPCSTWTTNLKPHQPLQHKLRKRGGCPLNSLGLGLGDSGCSWPSKSGIWTPGALDRPQSSALRSSSGPGPSISLGDTPSLGAFSAMCLLTSFNPMARLYPLSHPPSGRFIELLEHSGYEGKDDYKELSCEHSRLGKRVGKLSFTEHLLCAGDNSKHLTLTASKGGRAGGGK